MRVRVRFFAGVRERLGIGEVEQDLAVGATVGSLMDALFRRYPDLCSFRLRFAVNSAYVSLNTELHDGDEVACIPPVGGG